MKHYPTFEDQLARARGELDEKFRKKKQNLLSTRNSTEKKVIETQELIQKLEDKIQKLTKQKEDLIRKNENRVKYLEDLSR